MNRNEKSLLITIIVLILSLVLIFTAVFTQPYILVNGNVKVINTWKGGDLEVYENLTISYKQYTNNYILNCDFYHDGNYSLRFYQNWILLGERLTLNNPVGCVYQNP